MLRVVDEEAVLSVVLSALEEARVRKLNNQMREKLVSDTLTTVLGDALTVEESPLPQLVGLAEAAEILGTKKQYIARLISQESLIPAVRFASGPVFRKEHVDKYAVQLHEARRLREERLMPRKDK